MINIVVSSNLKTDLDYLLLRYTIRSIEKNFKESDYIIHVFSNFNPGFLKNIIYHKTHFEKSHDELFSVHNSSIVSAASKFKDFIFIQSGNIINDKITSMYTKNAKGFKKDKNLIDEISDVYSKYAYMTYIEMSTNFGHDETIITDLFSPQFIKSKNFNKMMDSFRTVQTNNYNALMIYRNFFKAVKITKINKMNSFIVDEDTYYSFMKKFKKDKVFFIEKYGLKNPIVKMYIEKEFGDKCSFEN